MEMKNIKTPGKVQSIAIATGDVPSAQDVGDATIKRHLTQSPFEKGIEAGGVSSTLADAGVKSTLVTMPVKDDSVTAAPNEVVAQVQSWVTRSNEAVAQMNAFAATTESNEAATEAVRRMVAGLSFYASEGRKAARGWAGDARIAPLLATLDANARVSAPSLQMTPAQVEEAKRAGTADACIVGQYQDDMGQWHFCMPTSSTSDSGGVSSGIAPPDDSGEVPPPTYGGGVPPKAQSSLNPWAIGVGLAILYVVFK